MAEKKNYLTREGLRKYEDELQNLKSVRRKEISQKIKEAREQGDLSENAEYDAAMDEQRDIEAELEGHVCRRAHYVRAVTAAPVFGSGGQRIEIAGRNDFPLL